VGNDSISFCWEDGILFITDDSDAHRHNRLIGDTPTPAAAATQKNWQLSLIVVWRRSSWQCTHNERERQAHKRVKRQRHHMPFLLFSLVKNVYI
jgi:hypothetical protein